MLVAVFVAGVLAASASGAWSAPFDVSPAGGDAFKPQVSVDLDGDAFFVWTRFDGSRNVVQARERSSTGALSPVQTLSNASQNAADPQVAVDDNGDAVFTWQRSDGTVQRIQSRARSAAGALSPVQNISPAGMDASQPQVGISAGGNAVFTWLRSDGTSDRVQARARTTLGALSPVQTLSAAGQDAASPRIAVDRDGDAVFAWSRPDGADQRIQTRARTAAGALSAIQNLSASGQEATLPTVAVDADGDAVFAWVRSDGTFLRIQTRARSVAGVLSAIQNLSAAGASASGAEVAVDGDGDAAFIWQRLVGGQLRAQLRARSAAGVLSGVQNASPAGVNAFEPHVGIDSGGDAVFSWRILLGGNLRIQARVRTAAGALQPLQTLSASGGNATASQVTVGAAGQAVVTWLRSDGADERVQGAAGP